MEPIEIGDTFLAHQALNDALNFPEAMISIRPQQSTSYHQQEKATAPTEITELRARKRRVLAGAQELINRMKEFMDASTFHLVLQGVMDIQTGRKDFSEIVEQLRPLVAHRNPQLFEDFLNFIEPQNNGERDQATPTLTMADEATSPLQLKIESLDDQPDSCNTKSSAAPYAFNNVKPLAGSPDSRPAPYVHPGQPVSPLRRVANFSRPLSNAGTPACSRQYTNEGSPGMSGFPKPPIQFYSPLPPTFGDAFYEFANLDRSILQRNSVETVVPYHGVTLPPIPAMYTARPRNPQTIDNDMSDTSAFSSLSYENPSTDRMIVRLPSVGRFGPGTNPYSPTESSRGFPVQSHLPEQFQFRPPKTRANLTPVVSDHSLQTHEGLQNVASPGASSSQVQQNFANLREAPLSSFVNSQVYLNSPYLRNNFTSSSLEEANNYNLHTQTPYYQTYSHQGTSLPPTPVAPSMPPKSPSPVIGHSPPPRTSPVPLQRKRGIANLKEQTQPRKVSRTGTAFCGPRASMGSSPRRFGTPPDNEEEKPYVHHICGRRFTSLEAVKGHHHSEEAGMGCWVRYGSQEKDKAWNMDPSCKAKVEGTITGVNQDLSSTTTKSATSKLARHATDKGKRNTKVASSSSSEHHAEKHSEDEYLPELGLTQKQLNEIQGGRPRRAAARKVSQIERGGKKK